MPVMDGYQATKIIRKLIERKQIKELRIVGTTADAIDNSLKTRCLEVGFDDVISKPVNKEIM